MSAKDENDTAYASVSAIFSVGAVALDRAGEVARRSELSCIRVRQLLARSQGGAKHGKRRLHQRPNAGEIAHCQWWLKAERRLVRPRLIVALGATAAEALTGSGKEILARRGTIEQSDDSIPVLLTIHPSYLLRLPNPSEKTIETERFHRDLKLAADYLKQLCL